MAGGEHPQLVAGSAQGIAAELVRLSHTVGPAGGQLPAYSYAQFRGISSFQMVANDTDCSVYPVFMHET